MQSKRYMHYSQSSFHRHYTFLSLSKFFEKFCNVLTGFEFPLSSVVDPILGGSTITSYIIPVTYNERILFIASYRKKITHDLSNALD